MSDIDDAIRNCRKFESLLKDRFEAVGRGLHEKLDSIEGKLPPTVIKNLRYVATIRNKIVHDHASEGSINMKGFLENCSRADKDLEIIAGFLDAKRVTPAAEASDNQTAPAAVTTDTIKPDKRTAPAAVTIAESALSDTITAIHCAAAEGDIKKIKSLAKGNPNVVLIKEKSSGLFPLHVAAFYGHANVVELLLARGADVNVISNYDTPSHLSTLYYHANLVGSLLAKGADVDDKPNHGQTSFHYVALSKAGQTPLHYAALYGHANVVELLLAKGANVNAKSKDDQTPLHYALRSNRWHVAALLRQHGGHE